MNSPVTIVPPPCGRELTSGEFCREDRRCQACQDVGLGHNLLFWGYNLNEYPGDPEYWYCVLVWNLTLGALLCAAEAREYPRAYDLGFHNGYVKGFAEGDGRE